MTYPRSLSMRDGCLTVAMTDSNTKRTQVEHFLSISVLLETIYAYYEHTGTHLAPFGGWRHEYPVDESTMIWVPYKLVPRTR